MKLDEILQTLGADKLNEDQQKEVSQKLRDIIDLKVKEKVDEATETEKEKIIEKLEKRFETYKKDITSKFSDFVDTVLEKELVIPKRVMKYAAKGRLYEDLIEQFKLRLAIDEGLIDSETKQILKDAKEAILKLQQDVNQEMKKRMVAESDAKEFAAEIYKTHKCEGLPSKQKRRVLSLLEGLINPTEIDRKFAIIVKGSLKEANDGAEDTNDCVCPECGTASTVKGACSSADCPQCSAKMKDADKTVGEAVVEKPKESPRSDTVFENLKQKYIKVLKENKF